MAEPGSTSASTTATTSTTTVPSTAATSASATSASLSGGSSPTVDRVRRAVKAGVSAVEASPTPTDGRVRLSSRPFSPEEWAGIADESGAMLVDHDVSDQRLVVRLIPSVSHNLAAGTLLVNLDSAIARMGLRGTVADLGSARIPLTASRFKEADGELVPRSRLDRGLNIPSFVLEVGVGEPPETLAEDARSWLLSSRTSQWVRAVVTVSIQPNPVREDGCQIVLQLLTSARRLLSSGRHLRSKIEWTTVWRSNQGAWPGPLRLPARHFLDLLQWPDDLPVNATIEITQDQMTAWADTAARVWGIEVAQRAASHAQGSGSGSPA